MQNIPSGKKMSGGNVTTGLLRNAKARRWFEVRTYQSENLISPRSVSVFETFSEALRFINNDRDTPDDLIQLVACDQVLWDSYLTYAVELYNGD